MDLMVIVLVALHIIVPSLLIRNLYTLFRARSIQKSGVLTERIIVSSSLLIVSIILIIRGVLRVFDIVPVSEDTASFITALALACLMVPSLVWEWMFRTGRLGK